MREGYVDEKGNAVDPHIQNKKILIRNGIIIGSILFSIILFFIIRNFVRSNFCIQIVKRVETATMKYMKENNLYKQAEGDYYTFDLQTLLEKKYLSENDITVNKKVAKGKIKVTKYKNDQIATIELSDCDYCDFSKKRWSRKSSRKPNKKVVDVIAYYNYQTRTINYTNWTGYITSDKLTDDVDKRYNIRLPKDQEKLFSLPKDAIVNKIEQETKEYYSYRDKQWKYFNGGGNYTSYFSSEQPSGYTNYDPNTLKYTEWTEYALDYPEKKEYRVIEQAVGYKWYYIEKGKKKYYKSGIYVVQPSDTLHEYKKDTKAGSAKMYRYHDKQWRWYTGQRRKYSTYRSLPASGAWNRDDELLSYTSYSTWSATSKVNSQNSFYREERVDTRYRYRIQYDVLSLPVLDQSVTKDTLEDTLKMSIDEILKRDDVKVTITYKFRYKK